MPKYTIANLNLPETNLRRFFKNAKTFNSINNCPDLDTIFEIALLSPILFPQISIKGECNPQIYINRWVKGYKDAINNLPSNHIATPKTSCTDPAIRTIVQTIQNLTNDQAINGEKTHNLFMSAENIQGKLLEQYIASKIRQYGFICCQGETLRAIDFCNTNGSCLLQIKNKHNSENSSSSSIREGTMIKKWYRLGTKTIRGVKHPEYKWDNLNDIVNTYKTQGNSLPSCNMTEIEYRNFLKEVALANPLIITNL